MKKRAMSVLLAVVMLLSCLSVGGFVLPASAASRVTKIAIVQRDMVLANDGEIRGDYGIFYDRVILDCFDYAVTYANGSKRTMSYYALVDEGIIIDGVLYTGEIKNGKGDERLFAVGKQSVVIQYGSKTYTSYVEISSFLEWCSNLRIKRDYDEMYIDYENQEIQTYYWRIKPDETNRYAFYSSGWNNIVASYTIFDANNNVVEYRAGSWDLKKGNEYCLRITYIYNDYCYNDITFHMEPYRDHTHRYAAATCTKPKTCKDCGHTTGKALGHIYEKKVTAKATLSANGKLKNVCSDCGKITYSTIAKVKSIAFKKATTTYDGKTKKPTVVVKDANGKTLKLGTDYTVTYPSGMKKAGTYKVKVTMKGKYSGTKTLTYKINSISVSTCKVSFKKATTTYNGKVKKPTVVVKNANGTTLKLGVHYKVVYPAGMKKVGTYKVKVVMLGNYSGTKMLTYKIEK